MTISEQTPQDVEELLTTVEQTLTTCAHDPRHVSRACDQLRQAVETLHDAADEDWCLCGRTLANLLEIVDCFADGADGFDAGTSDAIIAFVQASVPQLRTSLSVEGSYDPGAMIALVADARSRWGEYLTLVEGDGFYGGALLETELQPDGEQEYNSDDELADAADQVDLILSAVKELSQELEDQEPPLSGDEAVAPSPSSHGVPGSLPVIPSAPERISLSDVLREAYLEDAEQCLSSMERAVMSFENDSQGKAPVEQLGRDLHTLKGASASVGLSQLATYLHEIEEWLPHSISNDESTGLQPILDCVDFVRAQVEALQQPEQTAEPAAGVTPTTTPPPLPALTSGVDRSADSGEETVRVRSSQLDRMMNLLVDLVIWRRRRDRRVAELNESEDELARCVRGLETLAKGYSLSRTASGSSSANGNAFTDDDSRDSSSRLSEITNDLREIASGLRQCRQSMADENRAVSQFIQQFRQQLAQARRVPLSGLFQRLQRVVREAARLENKQVRLECLGQNTGLERSLQERLYEPLLHLVRNAVCHGIESHDNRVRAGKDAVGTITLEASGSSQMLILEVRDDGGGLDFDAIRRRGIERGLIRPDEPVSPAELSRLIFHPGFSTRTEANEVAGRGVGMDVVLTALNRCHCQIEVHSESGVGTTFRLAIPLPSVIEHSLVFRCGGQLFGLPMQFVMSTSMGDAAVDHTDEKLRASRLELSRILQLPQTEASHATRSLVLGSHLQPQISSTARKGTTSSPPEERREFVVDDILGPEEVVIRPLPPLLRRHPVLSGVTLSGAGEVVLLLDGPRLLKLAAESKSADASTDNHSLQKSLAQSSQTAPRKVLIAEDSLSARRRLVEKLQPHGLEITEASDGIEALNHVRATAFDAVFSDLEMPGLDGFELLTAIKNDPRTCDKPVVIVTSRDEAETKSKAHGLGADGFLSKPVSDASIEAMLEKIVMIPPRKPLEAHR